MPDVGSQVFDYFRQRISPVAAAGIVGNTQQESSNDPNAPGGGLIQGQGGRTSHGTLQQQLEGVWRELNGPERGSLNALRGARTPQQAARIFSQLFERPGIPMLSNRERYAAEAFGRYGHGAPTGSGLSAALGASGAPARPGAGPGGGVERTPAQIEDLMSLVDSLSPQGPSTSVEGLAAPRPTEGGAVRLPSEVPQEPSVSPASLLSAIDRIGQDASTAEPPSAAGLPARAGVAGGSSSPSGGPLTGFLPKGGSYKVMRTDKGKDFQLRPGEALLANGDYKVVAVPSDPSGFGPAYPVVEFTSGPDKGHQLYFGHTDSAVRVGQSGHAGDALAHTSKTGHNAPPGWVEIGLWGPGGPLGGGGGETGPGRTIARLLGVG